MDNDFSCVFQGLGSIGALYISNSKTANNFATLQKLNIKAVITAAKGRKINYCTNQIPSYLYLEIEDNDTFQIQKYFENTFTFIEKARKLSNVLIHCHIGVSLSVAIVIAYLIRKYYYSLPQIYTIIKRKRSRIEPSPGFIKQLQKYAEKYAILNNQLDLQTKKSKASFRRSSSLVSSFNSLKEQLNIERLIKSEMLNQNIIINDGNYNLEDDEKQKIASLRKQREQIEYKLRNLRRGLIRDKSIRKIIPKNSSLKKLPIQHRNAGAFSQFQSTENHDPNEYSQINFDKLIQIPNSSTRLKNKLEKPPRFSFVIQKIQF